MAQHDTKQLRETRSRGPARKGGREKERDSAGETAEKGWAKQESKGWVRERASETDRAREKAREKGRLEKGESERRRDWTCNQTWHKNKGMVGIPRSEKRTASRGFERVRNPLPPATLVAQGPELTKWQRHDLENVKTNCQKDTPPSSGTGY